MAKQMKEERIDPMRSRARMDERGREDHSNTGGPVAAALTVTKRDDLGMRVREMIRSEQLARDAAMQQMESFEEADDFDVGDDYDPKSPYEEVFEGNIMADVSARAADAKEKEAVKPPSTTDYSNTEYAKLSIEDRKKVDEYMKTMLEKKAPEEQGKSG